MILYVFWYKDFKYVVIPLKFWIFPDVLEIIFLMKIYENLSTFSNYECIQLKNIKLGINVSGNTAKKFEDLLSHKKPNQDGILIS